MPKNNKDMRPYKVYAIKDGTAIDHIPAGNALKIIRLLNLADENKIVTVGLNFSSKKMGKKDVVKVENRELTPEEISRIAIFAPKATINIIKDHKITKKFLAQIPNLVEYVVVCPNPKCITNNENMNSKFYILTNKDEIKLKCHYCEKIFVENEIREYKNN